jgi:hypothetical protein
MEESIPARQTVIRGAPFDVGHCGAKKAGLSTGLP